MPRPGPRPYECVRRAWHSDRHQPIRGSLIREIFRVTYDIHKPSTKKNREWQEKLPVVVLRVEEIMYSKANSEAEYLDPQTLFDRANDAINTIIRRDESTETGDLLQPCIEAALQLGCTPRRSSRSQRHSNPKCYLSTVGRSSTPQSGNNAACTVTHSLHSQCRGLSPASSPLFIPCCSTIITPSPKAWTTIDLKASSLEQGNLLNLTSHELPSPPSHSSGCCSSLSSPGVYLSPTFARSSPLYYGHNQTSHLWHGPEMRGNFVENVLSCTPGAPSSDTEQPSHSLSDCRFDLSLRLGPPMTDSVIHERSLTEAEDGVTESCGLSKQCCPPGEGRSFNSGIGLCPQMEQAFDFFAQWPNIGTSFQSKAKMENDDELQCCWPIKPSSS